MTYAHRNLRDARADYAEAKATFLAARYEEDLLRDDPFRREHDAALAERAAATARAAAAGAVLREAATRLGHAEAKARLIDLINA